MNFSCEHIDFPFLVHRHFHLPDLYNAEGNRYLEVLSLGAHMLQNEMPHPLTQGIIYFAQWSSIKNQLGVFVFVLFFIPNFIVS